MTTRRKRSAFEALAALCVQAPTWRLTVVEWGTAVVFLFAIAAPRGSFVYLGLLSVLLLALTTARFWSWRDFKRAYASAEAPSIGWLAVAAFAVYAGFSAVWSAHPFVSFEKAMMLSAVVAGGALVFSQIRTLDPMSRFHLARGATSGVVFGMIYLLCEILGGGFIKQAITNNTNFLPVVMSQNVVKDGVVVAILADFLNRNAAAIALMLWPAALASTRWFAGLGRYQPLITALFVAATFIIVFATRSETAKLALVIGLITAAAAYVRPKTTMGLLAAGWIALCLFSPHAIVTMLPAESRIVSEIQSSARARVYIWHHTIESSRERLLTGVGADMTPIYNDRENRDGYMRHLDAHAHNMFIQTWFELGAIGAALLACAGAAVLFAAARLPSAVAPCAAAQFASATAIAFSGYGMWQMWIFGLGIMSIAFLLLATPGSRDEQTAAPA